MSKQRWLIHSGNICLLLGFCWYWLGGIFGDIIGHPYGDMPDHFWGNNWFADHLRMGEWPLFTTVTHFPEGGDLWHIDPMGGVFRTLFFFLSSHTAWNCYLWLQLAVTSVVSYAFFYWRFERAFLSMTLSVMLVSSSYLSGLIHSGLSEYLGLHFAIGVLWAGLVRRWILTGILLGLCGWQAFSYGLIGALMLMCLHWRTWKGLLMALAISLLIVSPAAWLGWQTLHSESAAFVPQQAPGWNFAHLPSVDVFGWLRTGDWVHPDTPRLGNPGILQVHYLGWVVLGSFLVGLKISSDVREWARRIWLFALFSLGPRLSVGHWMPLGGWFLLPLALLYLPISPFAMVHHPYRMTAFLLPLLLVGVGLAWRTVPWFVQLLLLMLYITEQRMSPVPHPFLRTPRVEDVTLEGVRLDWPPDFSTANRRYLIAQTYHDQPIVAGVNRWISPRVLKTEEVQSWLRLLENPKQRSKNRDMPPLSDVLLPISKADRGLAEIGFEWVVVHREFLSPAEESQLLAELRRRYGPPNTESDGQVVFAVTK